MRNPRISLTELDAIISNATRWEYDSTKRSFFAHLDGGAQSPLLSKTVLDKKDVRLFKALRFFTQQVREDATAVRTTLAYWSDPKPMLQKIGQDSLRYTSAIHAFNAKTHGGDIILMVTHSGLIVQAGVTLADGYQKTDERRFHPDFLEKFYPGFAPRLECAISLGLGPVGVAQTAFRQADSAEMMTLPDALETPLV